MSHRSLNAEEIARLEANGCRAADWSEVRVADPFDPARLRRVEFSGEVRIGPLEGVVRFADGLSEPSAVVDSRLHDVETGRGVVIRDVGLLARMKVGDGALLAGVGECVVRGETAFGAGVRVALVNEGGGRDIPICEGLSAQIAWLLAFHRDDEELRRALEALVARAAAPRRASRGRIGARARLVQCGRLLDVAVGPHARVEGATELVNGTIASSAEAPTIVGAGVLAQDFIVLEGSVVDGAAVLDKTFVGQGCRVGKQFSAENCAFFANCEAFHGEACSLFAGPHAVTHHKGTLLIAAACSFFNAGSATNQSNHLYKLGPLHQGVFERGAKTGSGAYLLWPARVGPHSVVLGKHADHFDAGDLPFSYLIVDDGRTVALPGRNLATVGLRRDVAKWPRRDRRPKSARLDALDYGPFDAFVVERLRRGVEALERLAEATAEDAPYAEFQGLRIPRPWIARGADAYRRALRIFTGDALVGLLGDAPGMADALDRLRASEDPGPGWLDAAGMVVHRRQVEAWTEALRAGRLETLGELHEAVQAARAAAPALVRGVVRGLLEAEGPLNAERLHAALWDWGRERAAWNDEALADARKEFAEPMRIGYGRDAEARDADFEAVRGTFDADAFVRTLRDDTRETQATVERLLRKA